MAGNEIGVIDQIRHLDWCITKAQMRYGDAAGFFGIIGKICLGIPVRVIANDLDSALIGADRTIRPEAPELTCLEAFAACMDAFYTGQGFIGHIIDDAQGEIVLRFKCFQIFKCCYDIAR